jgi:predicted outer membrane protein
MRSNSSSKIVLFALSAIALTVAGACQESGSTDRAPVAVASTDSTTVAVDSAGGEVVNDSAAAPVAGRWLTDANVLSLLGTMNSRQIAAADAELQSWKSDSVRAFASSVAAGNAELQHSVDSLAGRMNIAPIAPALAEQVNATMQARIDSMKVNRGASLDRAFVAQQVAAQAMMADYVSQLSGVAQRPELQALLASASTRIGSQLARARALQRSFGAADSSSALAADSAAKRAARHTR